MNEGRIVGELSRAEASQEQIMALIVKDNGKTTGKVA
jgi:ABC-type sugar transport system ATPase subunit